jgi:hypothetical protein
METINYKGWPNAVRLTNEMIELVVTADVGPRIIRFGFVDGENAFKEYEDMLGKMGGDEWRIYGGHRLWHAPEVLARTYEPDNGPVAVEQHPDFVRAVQPVESSTGIQKEIDIRLAPDEAHAELTHRLRNTNLWTVELATWALSVMAPGGQAILPLPARGSHEQNLLPTNTLTLWAYTDLSDPRWTWGKRHIMLRQDPEMEAPQKLGAMVPDGWVAYVRQGQLFVKTFYFVPGAPYPDMGCVVEIFTNGEMLELETLGPTVRLEPNAAVEHTEHWYLFADVSMPQSDADVKAHILPKIEPRLLS